MEKPCVMLALTSRQLAASLEQALSGAPDSDGERFRVTAILGEEQ